MKKFSRTEKMETPTAFKKFSSGHLQNEESIKAKDMATSYYNFSLAICQHPDSRYLIVQETPKHQLLWWLPGGRVEHGDSFLKTSIKETKEEGGIDITPTKLLKIEQGYAGNRMRFIYKSVPKDSPAPEHPKTVADSESTQAIWTTVDSFAQPPINGKLRGSEPKSWFTFCSENPSYGFPLDIVHCIEVDETKLSKSELEQKRLSAVNRSAHKTVMFVEIVVYSKKRNSYYVSAPAILNKFPSFCIKNEHLLDAPIERMKREFNMNVSLVGILKIERAEAIAMPQGLMTVTFLALEGEKNLDDSEDDSEDDEFAWNSENNCNFSDREKEIMEHISTGQIFSLSLIGFEDGAPKEADIQSHSKLIDVFKQMNR